MDIAGVTVYTSANNRTTKNVTETNVQSKAKESTAPVPEITINVNGDHKSVVKSQPSAGNHPSSVSSSNVNLDNSHRNYDEHTTRRRCNSMSATEDGDKNESKVLVIYTGGTIGMVRNNDNRKYYYLNPSYDYASILVE